MAVWTSIGVNYSTYQPPNEDILKRYFLNFSKGGKGKLHEDDLGLVDLEGDDKGEYQAYAPAPA